MAQAAITAAVTKDVGEQLEKHVKSLTDKTLAKIENVSVDNFSRHVDQINGFLRKSEEELESIAAGLAKRLSYYFLGDPRRNYVTIDLTTCLGYILRRLAFDNGRVSDETKLAVAALRSLWYYEDSEITKLKQRSEIEYGVKLLTHVVLIPDDLNDFEEALYLSLRDLSTAVRLTNDFIRKVHNESRLT